MSRGEVTVLLCIAGILAGALATDQNPKVHYAEQEQRHYSIVQGGIIGGMCGAVFGFIVESCII